MSGPKVVRIVTREELVAVCEGHLARVEAALAEWTRIGRRNDCVSDAEVAATVARLESLKSLLRRDRFMDVQKQAPQEIAVLQDDMQARLSKVADAAAKARLASRRQAEAAGTLLKALQGRHRAIPPDLLARLEGAGGGRPDAQALAEGFVLLSDLDPAVDQRRQALAAQLRPEEAGRSLADWMAEQSVAAEDPAITRLHQRLAEFAQLADPGLVASYETRLAGADAAPAARRDLLLDSLEMDLGRDLTGLRKRTALAQAVLLLSAELAQVDPEAARALSAGAATAGADLPALIEQAEEKLTVLRERAAADARRQAVLQSLASLGYEADEGLATAWVEDGRVVLRRPAQPGYGVEITCDPAAAKMQMRVVAFEGVAPSDVMRDRDAETLWCGDVAALEQSLAAGGGALVIERALAVGATPVRRVAAPANEASRDAREGPAGRAQDSARERKS